MNTVKEWLNLLVAYSIALIFMFALVTPCSFEGQAQHLHDSGHNEYQGWASRKTPNCCNNQDCGYLADDEWRETPDGKTEIKIREKSWTAATGLVEGNELWCEVKPEHWTVKGRSPNGETAHACVSGGIGGCERILCFMGQTKS